MAKEMNPTLEKRLDNIDTRFDDLITVVTSLAKNTESQFNQIHSKFEKVDEQFENINGKFEKVDEQFDGIDRKFEKVDEQFESINGKFEGIDKKFEKVDEQLNKIATISIKNEHDISELKNDIKYIKDSHEKLMNTIDGFIARIDRYETEQLARDHEVARIKRWVQQIADKTGVKLTA